MNPAELERQLRSESQGGGDGVEDGADPIIAALGAAGFQEFKEGVEGAKIEGALRNLVVVLDGADSLRRAMVREAVIKKLIEVGVSSPARLIDAALGAEVKPSTEAQGRPVLFAEPEPWEWAVSGAELLEEIVAVLRRFVVLPPHATEAVALWIIHAHALAAFNISPLLAIISATKRAGKTLLLETVSLLVPRCLFASSITPAALFRAVEKFTPTLTIDEADTFLRENDELRGILNASHRKASAFVVRTVGDEHEPALFLTWCPKAIALIGKLPGTLEDRSILISMKRKAPGERVERFQADRVAAEFATLKRKAARWAADNLDVLRKADPEIPSALNDRASDNWRPLLAVADLAGQEWRALARKACVALADEVDEAENSALIQLLDDLRELFETREVDRLASSDIAETFGAMEERPWSEWRRGKPITQRQLAKLLAPLGIAPRTIRTGDNTPKGYLLEQFTDPFSRYLPLRSSTSPQTALGAGLRVICDPPQKADVADQNPLFPEGSKAWTQEI